MTENKQGTILKGIGGFYYVLSEGQVIECKAGGRLRKNSFSPLAGDVVGFQQTDGKGFILEILPRKNFFVRPPIANVDKLFITVSQTPPKTDEYLIDKMILIALMQKVEPIILITKTDLFPSDSLRETYLGCGFKVIESSAESGLGKAEIACQVQGCASVFSGNSGVGKSSIMNRVFDGLDLEIGAISAKINRGKNTTRTTEFYPIAGGVVADTPGFSSFDLTKMPKLEVGQLMHFFPEFETLWNGCRFNGCTHRKEPECAVKQALERGEIAQTRYDSYVKLYEELLVMKEW